MSSLDIFLPEEKKKSNNNKSLETKNYNKNNYLLKDNLNLFLNDPSNLYFAQNIFNQDNYYIKPKKIVNLDNNIDQIENKNKNYKNFNPFEKMTTASILNANKNFDENDLVNKDNNISEMSNDSVLKDINYSSKQRKREILKLKKDLPQFLEKNKIQSMRDVFDSFLKWNSSDDEDFYEDSATLKNILKKKENFRKYPPRHLYNTYDDFLSGYENDNYIKRFNALISDEKKLIENIQEKNLLNLEIDMKGFDKIPEINFERKTTGLNCRLSQLFKNKTFNFKSVLNGKEEEEQYKILTILGEYKFNYKALSPYMTNPMKIEDNTKPIVMHLKNNKAFIFKSVNINMDEKGKRTLFGKVNIEDLFKRADCLSVDRYEQVVQPISVVIKFLKMVKNKFEKNREAQKMKTNHTLYNKNNSGTLNKIKIYNRYKYKNKSHDYEDDDDYNEKLTKRSRGFKRIKEFQQNKENEESPQKKFEKINNEIYSLGRIKDFLRTDKDIKKPNQMILDEFIKKNILIDNFNKKLDGDEIRENIITTNPQEKTTKKKKKNMSVVDIGKINLAENISLSKEIYNMYNLSDSDLIKDEKEYENNKVSPKRGRRNLKLLLKKNTQRSVRYSQNIEH